MTEIPDKIDWQWIARHLVAFRRETRDELASISRDLSGLRDEMQGLREHIGVLVAGQLRLERGLSAVRQDIRNLFDANREFRQRIETLEDEHGRGE